MRSILRSTSSSETLSELSMEEEYHETGGFLKITTTLGSAVIAWSYCEEATEHFLRDLLVFHGMSHEAANLTALTVDLRVRCTLAIALCYKLGLANSLLEDVTKELNFVQNDLRNRRNRFVHDSWMFRKDTFKKRASTGPKIRKPQAHQSELHIPDYDPVDLEDVCTFREDCLRSSTKIHALLEPITDHWAQKERAQFPELWRDRPEGWSRRILRWLGKL